MLGKITEDGFIFNKIKADKLLEIETLAIGDSWYFYNIFSDILERLKVYFPLYYKEIFVISILRLIYGGTFKRIVINYVTIYLYKLLPNLSLSGSSISKILDILGGKIE